MHSQKRRYPGRSLPELPSREAVVAIVAGLVAALFPRHFGLPGLPTDDVDLFVADTLDQALRTLRQQVRRELLLLDADESLGQSEVERRALELVRDFAQDLPRIRTLLDSDIRAAFDGDPAAKSLDEVVFCYPGVAAIIRHRIAHRLYLLGAPLLARSSSTTAPAW